MLTHVRCRWKDQELPVADCRACARTGVNPCGFPLPIIKFITRDRDPSVVSQSATMLGGCPREHGIKKLDSYAVDPERAYTRAFGSLVHLGAESALADEENVISEKRYRRELRLDDGRIATVTAQLDTMYPQEDGTMVIHDYKVVNSIAPSALVQKVEHYIPQFSIQRWILAGMDITVSRVDLHFLMQRDRRAVNLFPEGEPDIPSAFIWSEEDTEAFLKEKLPPLVDALSGQLPDPITDRSQFWRCRYCDVARECAARYGATLPAFA